MATTKTFSGKTTINTNRQKAPKGHKSSLNRQRTSRTEGPAPSKVGGTIFGHNKQPR